MSSLLKRRKFRRKNIKDNAITLHNSLVRGLCGIYISRGVVVSEGIRLKSRPLVCLDRC